LKALAAVSAFGTRARAMALQPGFRGEVFPYSIDPHSGQKLPFRGVSARNQQSMRRAIDEAYENYVAQDASMKLNSQDLEKISDLTLDYYNQHAKDFWEGTRSRWKVRRSVS
jgi:hypothetical protein